HLRRTGLAHEAPLVECGPGEWIRAPTFHTPIEAWPVTEHVETAHAEAHGDAGRRRSARAGAQCAREQSVECGGWIALGGQAADALHDPGRLPESLEIRAERREWLQHVEVIDAHQLAASRVEEHELAEREQLQRAAEARAHAARGLCDAANLAVLARVERDHPVAFAEVEGPDHHRRGFAERHVRRSAGIRIPVAREGPAASSDARSP